MVLRLMACITFEALGLRGFEFGVQGLVHP